MILKGVRILDLSRVLAGPYCSQVLGDLGADVIKIEEPIHGDDTRQWGEPYYLSTNRNKRSVGLDLKSKKDLERVLALCKKADVVLENFKVGALKKFGLDYESLKKINPRLVYCSITGFGSDGPRAQEPGYDFLIQGLGGMMSVTGGTEPTKVGVAIVDLCTGLYAAIGILAALRERDASGTGQRCEISLLDTQLSLMSYLAMNFLCTGKIPEFLGNRHPSICPYESFSTKTSPLILTIGNNSQFEKLSVALGEKWHEDSRFKTNEERVQNQRLLSALISEKLITKSREDWMKTFEGKGFPFGPVLNIKEIAADPQVVFQKTFGKMNDGKTPNITSPLKFSKTPISKYKRPPKLNEHPDADFTV